MSWQTMALELAAQTPTPYPFCLTLVNRAWSDVQRSYRWSFLWLDGCVPTPSPISTGTVTLVIGSNQVVGDALATTTWQALPLIPPLATLQFRIGQGTIYNIIAYDGASTLTLDRIYVDPTQGAHVGYQIYGVYYNAPVKDFLWFETFTDPISGYSILTTKKREEAYEQDPQRWLSGWPQAVMPYRINPFPGTYQGFPQYEIWPAPLNDYTYIFTGWRSGMPFQAYTDCVPSPLGEDVVVALGKYYSYQWCEANKDKLMPEQRKGDFRFLMGGARKEYDTLLNDYQFKDESFSNTHLIPAAEGSFISNLPWVSMSAGLIYAP